MCNTRQAEDCNASVCRSFTASSDFCHQQFYISLFLQFFVVANTTSLGSMDLLP